MPWGHSAQDFPKKYLSNFPFRTTRLTTRISPLIEDPSHPQSSILADDDDNSPGATPHAFWPKVKDASGDLQDVLFHVQAEDWAGETIEFDMPMAMIRACRNGPDDVAPKELPDAYFIMIRNTVLPAAYPSALEDVSSDPALKRHLRPYGSQVITLAPPRLNSRNTAAEVITMALYPKCADIEADRDPNRSCLPAMAEAAIVLPMIRQFGGHKNPGTGGIEPTRVVYADAYRQNGFGEGNAGQLWLRLPDGVDLNFGADNRPDHSDRP